jgi:hypothetical protein
MPWHPSLLSAKGTLVDRTLSWVVLLTGLVLGPGARGNGAADPARPAPAVGQWIEQLGHRDFRVREKASKALEELGPEALPALRKAKDHPDPEVRRRLGDLIAPLETTLLLAPKRVTLRLAQKPLRAAVAELTKQTGYKIEVYGGNDNNVYNFQIDNLPFWDAIDQVCATCGLVVQHGWGDERLRLYRQEGQTPYIHHAGLFRVVAEGFNHQRGIQFGVARRNLLVPGDRSEHFSFALSIASEPRLPLLALGPVKVSAAADEQNNSLVPAERDGFSAQHFYGYYGRGLSQQAQVNLAPPTRDARMVRLIRGTIPVTVLVQQKPHITVDNVLGAKGKKFKADNTTLDIEDVRLMPDKSYQIKLSLNEPRKDNPNDYTWINSIAQRLELRDAKGNKYQSHGTNWSNTSPTSVQGTFMFGSAGNAALGPPAKFIYYTWVSLQHHVAFEFRDLPLP